MISRAVIIKDNKILLIHRHKEGREYYVIPGGHIEKDETEEIALIREIKEETNLDIEKFEKLWTLESPIDRSKHHIYLALEFSGDVKLGGPESVHNSKENNYVLEWHNISEIKDLTIYPTELKEKMVERFCS